jgi:flagellar biosynthesis/type III secretory pathway protein FliH
VTAVSIFEYNEEEEMRKIRASEYKNGKEDGIAQGIEQGIVQGMVETCKELGVSFEQTVARLKLRFDISKQEAQEKAGHYWC